MSSSGPVCLGSLEQELHKDSFSPSWSQFGAILLQWGDLRV